MIWQLRRNVMAQEHIDQLKKARTDMIDERRKFAQMLGKPDARKAFIEIQAVIREIDKAIVEETESVKSANARADTRRIEPESYED
jgi:hypothetical protein